MGGERGRTTLLMDISGYQWTQFSFLRDNYLRAGVVGLFDRETVSLDERSVLGVVEWMVWSLGPSLVNRRGMTHIFAQGGTRTMGFLMGKEGYWRKVEREGKLFPYSRGNFLFLLFPSPWSLKCYLRLAVGPPQGYYTRTRVSIDKVESILLSATREKKKRSRRFYWSFPSLWWRNPCIILRRLRVSLWILPCYPQGNQLKIRISNLYSNNFGDHFPNCTIL